jgi:hypothetical protein
MERTTYAIVRYNKELNRRFKRIDYSKATRIKLIDFDDISDII